ncbi:MAG: YetF domain-containing protein [Sulfitobacter sp.]
MIFDQFDNPALWRGIVLSGAGLVWIIGLVRIIGLRSFSKMTSFDFVITVALGSLLAGAAQATEWSGFIQSISAIGALMIFQFSIALVRQKFQWFEKLIGNQPVVLMENGVISHAALSATRVSKSDLLAKLREANALDPQSVKSAVLEATGDVSVLHGGELDEALISGLRRYP